MVEIRPNPYFTSADYVASVAEYFLLDEVEARAAAMKELNDRQRRAYEFAARIDPLVLRVQEAIAPAACYWRLDNTGWRGVRVQCWLTEPISNWREVTPVIESLADLCPVDQWENEDQADDWTRKYIGVIARNSENNRAEFSIEIYARLPGDTKECRRVIKGFTEGYVSKPEPVYAFECQGEDSPLIYPQENKDARTQVPF